MTKDNNIEEFILEMHDILSLEQYKALIFEHLPNVKKLVLYFSDKNGVPLSLLIKVGLIKPVPISFRLICTS